MTPEEVITKCEENGVKLLVKNGKLLPVGNLTVDFIKLSHQFIPYKQQVIDFIKVNTPDRVVEGVDEPFLVASNGQAQRPSVVKKDVVISPEEEAERKSKIERLRIPCIHLGPPLEKAAGCGCNGAVIHKCDIFEKCRRSGTNTDSAICTSCDKYQAIK